MEYYMMRSEQAHEARRVRRRVWFTLHGAACVLCSLGYSLVLTPDLPWLALHSLLLATIFAHAAWLYMVGLVDSSMLAAARSVQVTLAEFSLQPAPLLTDGKKRLAESNNAERDFWFQWHDLR